MVKAAFYKGKGRWVNTIIRWWTNGPYSHTEIITREQDGAYLCFSSYLPDGGVRGKWRVLDLSEWDFVEIDADPTEVEKWYNDRSGCGYDLLGLLGFVLRRDFYDRNKYFCSEANMASLGFNQAWRFDPNAMKVIVDHLAKKQSEGK